MKNKQEEEVRYNVLEIKVQFISSDCIEISLGGIINNLTILESETIFYKRGLEFFNRLISSGYTNLILDCENLFFYDAPEQVFFAGIQDAVNKAKGRMVILNINERDKASMMEIREFVHHENDRGKALQYIRENKI